MLCVYLVSLTILTGSCVYLGHGELELPGPFQCPEPEDQGGQRGSKQQPQVSREHHNPLPKCELDHGILASLSIAETHTASTLAPAGVFLTSDVDSKVGSILAIHEQHKNPGRNKSRIQALHNIGFLFLTRLPLKYIAETFLFTADTYLYQRNTIRSPIAATPSLSV